MSTIKIYHGSSKIIEKPVFGQGKVNNDYGQAFYCAKNFDMACEWACAENANGYVNEYELVTDNLTVLDLTDGTYNVLNWLAILLENRTFSLNSDIAQTGYDYLIENFGLDYKNYDIIKGYRADDSYFSFANAFLNNLISLEKLSKALKLEKFGEQLAIKSERAFDSFKFIGAQEANHDCFYPKKAARDCQVRDAFSQIKETNDLTGTYLINILQNQWRNGDVSI